MYEPAWALQAAIEEMGYEDFYEVPEDRLQDCFDLADFIAGYE